MLVLILIFFSYGFLDKDGNFYDPFEVKDFIMNFYEFYPGKNLGDKYKPFINRIYNSLPDNRSVEECIIFVKALEDGCKNAFWANDQNFLKFLYNQNLGDLIGVGVDRYENEIYVDENTTRTEIYYVYYIKDNSIFCNYKSFFIPQVFLLGQLILNQLAYQNGKSNCEAMTNRFEKTALYTSDLINALKNEFESEYAVYEDLKRFLISEGCLECNFVEYKFNQPNSGSEVIKLINDYRSATLDVRIKRKNFEILINKTIDENNKLITNISNNINQKLCIEEDIIQVDFEFSDGTAADNCKKALEILKTIKNYEISEKMFVQNRQLKELLNLSNHFKVLNNKSINQGLIAVKELRKELLLKLSKTNIPNKEYYKKLIQRDFLTIGQTYLYLKNFEIIDYGVMYEYVKSLIQKAKLDEIDVSLEEIMIRNIDPDDPLPVLLSIKNSIITKATNSYSHLSSLRTKILNLLKIAPPSIALKYEVRDYNIERDLGKLKSIENSYKSIYNSLEKELSKYLSNKLNIEYTLIYPREVYPNQNAKIELIATVCNPYPIKVENINPNMKIYSEFKLPNIKEIYPEECINVEATSEKILAKLEIINISAKLIDNNLNTLKLYKVTMAFNGTVIIDNQKYVFSEGYSSFEKEDRRNVIPQIRDINSTVKELYWNFGMFNEIYIDYYGYKLCDIPKQGFVKICSNRSLNISLPSNSSIFESFNSSKSNLSIINDSINRSLDIPNSSSSHINLIIQNAIKNNLSYEKELEKYAKSLYSFLKSKLKTSEGLANLNYLYQQAIFGNITALEEMEKMQYKDMKYNNSIIELYKSQYMKEYFDLSPLDIEKELKKIGEVYLYDEEKAYSMLQELYGKIEAQFEIAKSRIRSITERYGVDVKNKIEDMLKENKIKESVSYLKTVKPGQVKTQTKQDPLPIVVGLAIIGATVAYMIFKQKPKMKTLDDEENN